MNDVRWLTEREQQVWRTYLQATWMLTEHLQRQMQQDSGIPHTYYEILVNLSEAPDRTMRMSELAERSHASRSRLSHAVARLEQLGWILRRSCEQDKRGAWAWLTEDGLAALRSAAPGHVATVRKHLFDVLTEEQVDALGEISAAIRDGLAPACAEVAAQQAADYDEEQAG